MVRVFRRSLWLWLVALPIAAQTEAPPQVTAGPGPDEPRPVDSTLELQVELHRRGFSCGAIDGVPGAQTTAALRAWQRSVGIRDTGVLDAATRERVRVSAPPLTQHLLSASDLEDLRPVPTTWLGKSEQLRLGYATALELLAERYRASPRLIRRLNAEVNWDALAAGVTITVPAVQRTTIGHRIEHLVIRLGARELEGIDAEGRVWVHFPVSIARKAEKRPQGALRITVVIPDPNYTFDPEVFTESAEARELGRRLILPPGPNNPVGLAWIGLDLPGYGIHGTPDPEKVGRTESHGCFRLANWDAITLLSLVRVGMTVFVEP